MLGAITCQSSLACSSNEKGRSLIVEESFCVQITHISCIVFELCVSKKKERKKERKD